MSLVLNFCSRTNAYVNMDHVTQAVYDSRSDKFLVTLVDGSTALVSEESIYDNKSTVIPATGQTAVYVEFDDGKYTANLVPIIAWRVYDHVSSPIIPYSIDDGYIGTLTNEGRVIYDTGILESVDAFIEYIAERDRLRSIKLSEHGANHD